MISNRRVFLGLVVAGGFVGKLMARKKGMKRGPEPTAPIEKKAVPTPRAKRWWWF